MTAEDARAILHRATWDDDGTFTLLRLGKEPGRERVHELRLALRILWRHWKSQEALPFDIAQPAAMILHFRSECERNLKDPESGHRESKLDDVAQGAFELLCGRDAERETVRRPDLGE